MTRAANDRRLLTVALLLILSIRASAQIGATEPLPSDIGAAILDDTRNVSALNVSIAIFDPGVPDDRSLHRDLKVFPQIREIEAMILPFELREILVTTGQWGAVRVVPEPDAAAELLVTGEIGRSDGDTLEIKIRAVDASGVEWLNRTFAGIITGSYSKRDNNSEVPGHQSLYEDIAENLRLARDELTDNRLANIIEISTLRYAQELAPTAFGGYLRRAADGTYAIHRLPAKDDPMLARISRIRGVEYVITDAVDAKFQDLHAEVASIYDVWRKYRRKNVDYQEQDRRRAQRTESDASRGSFEALKNLYDNYKWDRITAQEQDSLAVAFNNEVGPRVAAVDDRVAELRGWVDQKYSEWHRLLEELFDAETGIEK